MNKIGRYWPLFVLILVAAAGAAALTHEGLFIWMHYFMGFFLCQFAMLKLFHPAGFAKGFQMYDLVARKFRGDEERQLAADERGKTRIWKNAEETTGFSRVGVSIST